MTYRIMHTNCSPYYVKTINSIFVCCDEAVYYTNSLFILFKDELIRQITINCAERGVLLVRVRDEARMAIAGV